MSQSLPSPVKALPIHRAPGEFPGVRSGMLQRKAKNLAPSTQHDSSLPPLVGDVLRSPGQPLDSGTRGAMESHFGHDFGHVRIHTDRRAAESAQAVDAEAYTAGPNIVFGAGRYQPKAESGRQLLVHELTHVIQQRGVTSPPTVLGDTGDTFEDEANRASCLPSAVGPSHFFGRAGASVQRYQIEGPYDINDPVHERITEEALRKAGLLKPGQDFNDPDVWEYIRGAMWNDDPKGQLFDKNKTKTNDYSSGIEWYNEFKADEKKATKGTRFGPPDDLLARSHFGDLQFIHGMAASEKEAAAVSQGKVMQWAEFTYKAAIGEIPGPTTLGAVGVTGIPELFPSAKDQTVSALFGIANLGDVSKRAAGSLLHVIQDSYASGHVQREELPGGRKGRILSFHSYSGQDHDTHGHDDALQGKGSSDADKLKNVPGATDAIDRSAQILKFISEKRPWEDVELYLKMEVFNLGADPLEAGSGDDYRKKGSAPEPEYHPTLPKDTGDYEVRRGKSRRG